VIIGVAITVIRAIDIPLTQHRHAGLDLASRKLLKTLDSALRRNDVSDVSGTAVNQIPIILIRTTLPHLTPNVLLNPGGIDIK
jgi:hypothetical protein